jgi:hypothetical protein
MYIWHHQRIAYIWQEMCSIVHLVFRASDLIGLADVALRELPLNYTSAATNTQQLASLVLLLVWCNKVHQFSWIDRERQQPTQIIPPTVTGQQDAGRF